MGVRHCFSLGLGGAALTVKGKTSGTPDVGFAKSPRTLPPLKRARVASGDRPEPTEAAAETTKPFARAPLCAIAVTLLARVLVNAGRSHSQETLIRKR